MKPMKVGTFTDVAGNKNAIMSCACLGTGHERGCELHRWLRVKYGYLKEINFNGNWLPDDVQAEIQRRFDAGADGDWSV